MVEIEKNLNLNKSKLKQAEAVTLSCLSLDGYKKKVHTEEIAAKAHQISNDFSWALPKYKKFPDMARVRKAIDRAKDTGWLIGGYSINIGHDGWQVTDKGREAVSKFISDIKIKKKSYELTAADNKFLNNVKKHSLYKDFLNDMDGFEVNVFSLSDMLSSISEQKHIRNKFFNLKRLVDISENSELKNFTDKLIAKIPNILNFEIYKQENTVKSKQRERIDL